MTPLSRLSADWPHISALLDQALALPLAQREAWLAALAGPDAAHREPLRQLLATQAELEGGDFLQALPQLPDTRSSGEPAPGLRVGPWRLVLEIGRGGMGSVWLAERADGLMDRRVALKLPRVTWHDAFTERLARERRILAGLEHPHIARLYDVGQDDAGRPWLAMEHVEGEAIDTWCRQHALTLRERVALVLQVADAVAHAHARLVVHRDLKPANILVTPAGQTKLLDFGIAKLLEDDGPADATALTELTGRAMTLAYASPEQVRGEPLGTASDIYSLGVVACELLAGGRPYRTRHASRAELEEAIVSQQELRASDVAPDRATARALRGDLDAVLGTALKKATAERYPTMDAFARDLRRWLAGEPVEARPDGWRYRTAKFVLRHRVPVAAGTAVVLALAVGATVALWQARQAGLQAHKALAEAATAKAVQDFLEDIFQLNGGDADDPDSARQTTASELLARGEARIDSSLADAPEAHLRLLGTMAAMYSGMAALEKAAELQQRRVALARTRFGADSREAAEALAAQGAALALLDRRREASAAVNEAAGLLDRLGDSASSARFSIEMTRALIGQRADYPAGLAAAERAVAIARQRHARGDLVRALQVRSEIAASTGEQALARDSAQEAIAIAEQDLKQGGNQLSALYVSLADAQVGLNALDEADASFQRAIAIADQRNRIAPIYRHTAERRYGSFLRRYGRLREAVAMHQPGYAWARANPAGYGTIAPMLVVEYGRALAAYGRPEQGLAVYDEGLTLQQRSGGNAPETVASIRLFRGQALLDLGRLDEARAESRQAHAYFDLGKSGTPPALAALDRGIELRAGHAAAVLRAWQAARVTRQQPADPELSAAPGLLTEAARLHLAAGDGARSAALAQAALQQVTQDPQRAWRAELEADATRTLGEALLQQGEAGPARENLARALVLAQQVRDPQRSPAVADTLAALALAQARTGDTAGARASAEQARRIRATHADGVSPTAP
ncbi:MAG TPA: serine/threonine-protein kinase [Ideonella sp.]|uniref:serine/threonine-protein kinase n=1 Tax=Ideonella sp. TaxID=1929293 RepID=UPI002C251BEB|nr:serine/threonine-protein kinase [Ideonella sp.]HSI48550.1 serine/threonine-protein kinase [Ideonella sp.]